ncbi:MAG: 5'-methylthioadenosine/S-adenosylhomocysteine nucleosidase [Pseudomonadota bacterium]
MIINGIRIMTLMAAEAEYGDYMKAAEINPKIIGVGPIEAAFNTTRFIMEAIQADKKPDIIFSVGSAGSNILKRGEIYQIHAVSYRDMDASPFGFKRGVTPFVDYPATFELPILFQDAPKASLSTGAAIIDASGSTGNKFEDISEECVDMESYAVCRAALHFKIPVIGLRGITDGEEQVQGEECWKEYLQVIDQKITGYYERIRKDSSSLVTISNCL